MGDNNMVEVETGVWAFMSGDLDQNDNVDQDDYPLLQADVEAPGGTFGFYATDLNGDGNVDQDDYPKFQAIQEGFSNPFFTFIPE